MVEQIDLETGEVLKQVEWELLCEQGRIAASNMDEGRWLLGELALMVDKQYGDDAIGEFAKDINVPKKRIAQYRTVYKFWSPAWEKSKRLDFLGERPNLSYTHYLNALRLKDLDEALKWIDEASSNGWTTDEAAHHLAERLGKAPIAPPKILETVIHIINQLKPTQIVIDVHPEAAALLIAAKEKPLRIAVWEAEG